MLLDKCYRSWKADLEIGFSPLDASLDRFVDFSKPSFMGRDALLAERDRGSRYRFVPLVLDEPGRADAPANSSVFSGEQRVGIVTSGGWSFTLDASIALAHVEGWPPPPGTHMHVEIVCHRVRVSGRTEPLYDPRNERLRSG